DDVFPFLLPLRLAVGEDDGAAFVLDGVDQYLDRFARLGRHNLVEALVVPFVERDNAFALVIDVDPDLFALDAEDPAGDDLVDFFFFFFGRKPLFLGELLLELVFGDVELAEEITVDHRYAKPFEPLTFARGEPRSRWQTGPASRTDGADTMKRPRRMPLPVTRRTNFRQPGTVYLSRRDDFHQGRIWARTNMRGHSIWALLIAACLSAAADAETFPAKYYPPADRALATNWLGKLKAK